MSVRHLLAADAAVLLEGFGPAAPVAAYLSVQPVAASVYTMSPGRIGAVAAGVLALIGVVVGGLARVRSAGRTGSGSGRRNAVVALTLGSVGAVVGVLVVLTADGGLGTGNGLGGGVVALVLGLVAMVLGGLELARSRRTG